MHTDAQKLNHVIVSLNERIIDVDVFFDEFEIPLQKQQEALNEFLKLEKEGVINKVNEGLFYKSEISRVTKKEKILSEKDIVDYYTANSSGIIIDYDLYNRKNISTQISKKKIILSNRLKQASITIESVTIKKLNIQLDQVSRPIIEALEIIENADTIQYFNNQLFIKFMIEFINNYDCQSIIQILNQLNYKKETVYNLHKILLLFEKNSGLEPYLINSNNCIKNYAYKTIEMHMKNSSQ